jgi:hypothetical protein
MRCSAWIAIVFLRVFHTCKSHRNVYCASLECRADGEDDNSYNDRPFPTEAIGYWSIDEGTEPSSEQQRRDEPAFEGTVYVDPRKGCSERLHGQHTRDDTLIITEEETTE